MPDVRARIAEALREHGTSAIPTWANERICLCGETFRSMPPGPDLADHVADVLLSLPGIAIVDLNAVDLVAQAICDSHHNGSGWDPLPADVVQPELWRNHWRTLARAALLASAEATA